MQLLDRNRLALVVLAASLASNAKSRARGAYVECGAVRWLARNARTVRHFLLSLANLRRCARRAGYRALGRARTVRRLAAAPRRLPLVNVTQTPAWRSVAFGWEPGQRAALMRL